jgi:hypothetical protein
MIAIVRMDDARTTRVMAIEVDRSPSREAVKALD